TRRTDMSTSTALRPHDVPNPATGTSARPGPLGRLAGVTFRHRGRTVLAWFGALALAVLLSTLLGGQFRADYSAPGSDSQQAQQLLADKFPAQSGDTVDLVVHSDAPVTSSAVKAAVTAALAQISAAPHVAGV